MEQKQSNRSINLLAKTSNSLRKKLLISTVGIILLTGLVIAGFSNYNSYQNGRQQVIDQLDSISALKKHQINTLTRDLQTSLAVLLADPNVYRSARTILQEENNLFTVNSSRLRTSFREIISLTGSFDEVLIVDRNGVAVVSSNAQNEGQFYGSQPFAEEGMQRPYLQPMTFSRELGEAVLYAAHPIIGESGRAIGILVGRANGDVLNTIMEERTGFGSTGETYLVDSKKILLTTSRFQGFEAGQTEVDTFGVQESLQLRKDGTGLYNDYRGTPIIGAYRWLPDLQVVLLSEQDQAEAFSSIYTNLVINIVVAGFAVAIAIAMLVTITGNIANPLSQLADTAVKVAGGNLDLRTAIARDDEIGDLAQAFNQMTDRLQSMINLLEHRVEERTKALQTSTEISQQMVAILDTDELLSYVVTRFQEEFGFYHAHIYLVEDETGDLVLTEGAGEAGWGLKEKGHRLQQGQGIVGRVAASNTYFVSNNIDEFEGGVRNQLLPETQSELAVPIAKAGKVFGVLDIQSKEIGRFSVDDIAVIQSIANQTAVALDNARLLRDTQHALEQVKRLNSRLTQESWTEFSEEISHSGYRYLAQERGAVVPDTGAWLAPMEQAAKNKQLIKQIYPPNGEQGRVEMAVPLMLRGEVIGVLGVKRESLEDWADEEVSAVETVANQVSRALENARLSREQEKTIIQLKEIDQLKSEFLTSMSHELRTPLNSIIGFADVLLQGIDGDLPDMALNDIQLIHNSGQHLLALINDILDLSKIEAGKMELVKEPIDVGLIFKEVLAAGSSLVKDKPVDLITEKPDDLPPVYADKLRLRQILLNLVSNAAKFTEKGSITVRASIIDEEPDMMRISVIDTGIGIPAGKLKTIFDRFRQADSSTTRKYGGTGLGLAISLNLTEMHGGQLRVKSKEGVGSEFYCTIPLAGSGQDDEVIDAEIIEVSK